jgi:hypothetical protein
MNSEWTLELQIEELEAAPRPGCQSSSSTSPRCTCPVIITDNDLA